jgi:hypothetical protein
MVENICFLSHPEAFPVGKPQNFQAVRAVVEIALPQERSHLAGIKFVDGCAAERAERIFLIVVFHGDHFGLLYGSFLFHSSLKQQGPILLSLTHSWLMPLSYYP